MRYLSKILLLILLSTIFVFGQTSGKIVGTVTAPDGALIPGATVIVTDNQTKKERTVTASDDGTFTVQQLEFGSYSVRITATGYKTFSIGDVKIDAGREYPLNARLEVGQVSETVTVVAGAEQINSTNAELSTTISREQIRELPLDGRNPLSLLNLTAGAGPTTNSINGQRSSSTTITRDGLNVQDNFIRSGAFVQDRPTVDDTGEFTVTTQNAGAEQGGGSSLIRLVTPRGGSKIHGNLFIFNRNSKFTSNSFFNNEAGLAKPFLNRNQFGGTISGPMPIFNFGEGGPMFLKNKAYFFANYEGYRLAQQVNATARTLLPQARNGTFTYIDTVTGAQRTINVLTGAGFATPIRVDQGGVLPVDPTIQSRVLSQLPNSGNGVAFGTNYLQDTTFLRSNPVERNAITTRFDIDFNDRNTINFVYKRNNEANSRTDIASGFSTVPFVNQGGPTNLFVGAYRWTPTARFSNEFRGGFQYSEPFFQESNVAQDFIIGGLPVTNPEGTFRSQGRNTLYRNFQDNAVYTFGNHSFSFGGQAEFFKVESLNFVGTTPTYTISTTGNLLTPGITADQIGNINSTDLARVNTLRYFLGGIIGGASRTANLADINEGFTFGPSRQILNYELYSAYFSDQWRILKNLTLNLGLRYEYYTPLNSPQALYLEPVIKNNDLVASILDPNGVLNIVGGNSGTRGDFTKPDRDNFGPNVSFAYSPRFEKGLFSKLLGGGTVIRGGVRVNYVNDEYIKSTSTLVGANQGLNAVAISAIGPTGTGSLQSALTPQGVFGAVPNVSNLPGLPTLPITFAQYNAARNFGSQVFGVDPNLQVQRVYEYNVGVQRNIGFKSVFEVRYVGGFSNDLIRTTTFNQVDTRSNGFLDDFLIAQQNCRLQGATRPGAATAFDTLFLCTDARYNPAIAGSRPLTVFNNLAGAGLLNNSTVVANIQQGRVGSLAQLYITNRLTGTVPLVKNPNIFLDEILQNGGTYRYNALQAEVRRRFTNGLSYQINYTFAKTLSNIPDEGQNRQGELQDNSNPGLNTGRPDYDRTHTLNANFIFELPFGKGKKFFNQGGWVDKVVGGFQFTSIINLVSGPPLGVIDPRSTSAITFTSGRQSATSTLTDDEIKQLTGIFRTPNGIYFIDPKVLCATATAPGQPTLNCFDLNQSLPAGYTLSSVRGASPLGTAPFPGQVFFFNQAGSTGNLPRNFINGAPYLNWNAGLSKSIRFGETQRVQIRVEAFNVLNKQVPFFSADLDVSSTSFGRVTTTYNSPRIIQFGIRYDF